MAFDVEDKENVFCIKQWRSPEVIPSVGEYIDLNDYDAGDTCDDALWRIEGIIHNRDLDHIYLHVRKVEDAYDEFPFASQPKEELWASAPSDDPIVLHESDVKVIVVR